MPEALLQKPNAVTPLVALTEDEQLSRDNIRQFADEKVRPLVREMDEKQVFDQDLIQQLFQLGLMSIEILSNMAGAAELSSRPSWRWKRSRGWMRPPACWWMCRTRWW